MGGGQRHAPAALPPGNTRHPLYRRLNGPYSRDRRLREISISPGFDPRTVQSIAQPLYRLSYPNPIHLEEKTIKLSWTVSHVRWLKEAQSKVSGTSWSHLGNEFSLVVRSSLIAFVRLEGVNYRSTFEVKTR